MDERAIADAYIYLLGRALVIRQEVIDRGGQGFGFNRIKYNPLGTADFVNPNFDVAYLEGWIAVDPSTPAILEVPEVAGRYYTAQILDEWGEVIANINERTFPSKPYGKFALVYPGSTPALPPGTSRIALHSGKAKLLGRVELKDDPDGAVALQRSFALSSVGNPVIANPPAMPLFPNDTLIGVDIFDNIEQVFASALDVSPVAARMQQQVRALAAEAGGSATARADINRLIHEKIVPRFKVFAFTKSAPYRNHWVGGSATGNYGSDYWVRTVVNFAGIWANTTDEVVYFMATRDADEKTLNGSNGYVIHFAADKLPDSVVDAYWSVILVDATDYRVVPNELKRYNFNNHSPLTRDADGSIRLGIGAKPPAGVPEANWLPAAEGKDFSLTFRTYVPKPAVMAGEWAPPAVMRAG